MIYSIWEGYIEEVTTKAQKVIAKCNKYGCEYRFEILDTESFRKTEDGEIVRYVDVLLEGVARVGKWELIASIEHTVNGNIIRSFYKEELPAVYQDAKPSCDHCHTNRLRKNTFIVRNLEDGELRQVGETCLKDYTGISLATAVRMRKLCDEMDEFSHRAYGVGNHFWFDTQEVLAYAFDVVKKDGYVKYDEYNPEAMYTSKYVRQNFPTAHGISEEGMKKAEKAIVWASQIVPENNYLSNLKTVAGLPYVGYKQIGILVSLVPVWERAMHELERSQNSVSEWVGEEGKKLTIAVKNGLRLLTWWETDWGVTHLYAFTDTNGNEYTWKASKAIRMEGDQVKQVVGTVKGHNEYKGIKQTELTRCKVSC